MINYGHCTTGKCGLGVTTQSFSLMLGLGGEGREGDTANYQRL